MYKQLSSSIRQAWVTQKEPIAAPGRSILKAASVLYEMGLRKDQASLLKRRVKLPVPVISIGNLSVGGTGKTPLTIWMCEFLLEIGFHPAVLTRGYGRKENSSGRIPVGDNERLWQRFGDEPVMMSEYLPSTPVWVGRDRAVCGRAALAGGDVDVLVLDDGFQHLGLDRVLDMVLLDSRNPFGNGLTLPAGPLREPLWRLERADVFVLTHGDESAAGQLLKKSLESLWPAIPSFACNHRLRGLRLERGGPLFDLGELRGRKAVAFAGIAAPESFFDSLQKAGIEVCRALDFPDHHEFATEDLLHILKSASSQGAGLIVTTAKDFARLPHFFKDLVAVAEAGMDFGPDGDEFRRFLALKLRKHSGY